MIRLSVNIDHVATVRQARRGSEPDPVHAAVLAELGGADGITVHLRGDRRHIQDRDVEVLRKVVRSRFNLRMAATQEMIRVALTLSPDQVTLVPERPEEISTEGGVDVVLNAVHLRPSVKMLEEAGIVTCPFIEPALEQVKEAHKLGARSVELSTASWADSGDARGRDQALGRLTDAARLARKLGLRVHAGHGLDYLNVSPVAALGEIAELCIGHSIVSRALLVGMERAVRDMADTVRAARSGRV
jgi:pyridoxine 5-phosphate synthase